MKITYRTALWAEMPPTKNILLVPSDTCDLIIFNRQFKSAGSLTKRTGMIYNFFITLCLWFLCHVDLSFHDKVLSTPTCAGGFSVPLIRDTNIIAPLIVVISRRFHDL